MDPVKRLNFEQEKADYDLHQNSSGDAGYRNYLNQLLKELLPFLDGKSSTLKGLDYGCGPGPTLSIMLEEVGISTVAYDPIYFDDRELLRTQYDVVTCSEVVEHFYDPCQDFYKLVGLLRPQGLLGIMTTLLPPEIDFSNWHYIRERTHVGFYSKECFDWIADRYNLSVLFCNSKVVIMRRLSG